MQTPYGVALALTVTLVASTCLQAAEDKIAVAAAENFYGDVAQQIGGDHALVTSIISNPNQDPHFFETSPTVARKIVAGRIVVYNGAGYDPWMETLLKAAPKPGRVSIIAADLVHASLGANPHLWYDPATMPAVARALAAALTAADPAHSTDYAARLKSFLDSLRPVTKKIAEIRARYSGTPVTSTEPIFGYMARALDLKMRNKNFQLAVMNDTEPSARDFAKFESDLKTRAVQVLFFNTQASDSLVPRLVSLARIAKIPVVGVTETCPPNLSYQDWMLRELDQTERALAGTAP
jgi:zinc/manganese transport system substrate-binding protein